MYSGQHKTDLWCFQFMNISKVLTFLSSGVVFAEKMTD